MNSNKNEYLIEFALGLCGIIIWCCGLMLGLAFGLKVSEINYRQKSKDGFIEYYDEVNQRWLWKKGENK